MGKYLFHANYTVPGLTGLIKEGGRGRRAALTETIEGLGGSVESLYWARGGVDLYIVAELPDEASAAAATMTIGAAGALEIGVTELLTPEAIDEAVAKHVSYRPPGA